MKAQKTTEKHKLNGNKSSAKAPNGSFPMAGLLDEQVRSSISDELTALEEAVRKREKKKLGG